MARDERRACLECKTVAPPKLSQARRIGTAIFVSVFAVVCLFAGGSGAVVAFALWFYAAWILKPRSQPCAACGGKRTVPIDSPAGREVLAAQGSPPRQTA
jgi:hypothetical protein